MSPLSVARRVKTHPAEVRVKDLRIVDKNHLAADEIHHTSFTVSSSTVGSSTVGSSTASSSARDAIEQLRRMIAEDVVSGSSSKSGKRFFSSPFIQPLSPPLAAQGSSMQVPLVYADQTASNRALISVEQYLFDECLPLYGNTHTNTSLTGSQSTSFVAEARKIVAEGCNANSSDVVLFAGSGATSAFELLIDCLGLKALASSSSAAERPLVFIGPYEHHSNILPWRETGCEVIMVPESPQTMEVDLAFLEKQLQKNAKGKQRLMMGTFSSASNVNGKVSDLDAIASTLHRYGALAFFDFATGAPYLPIDMHPAASGRYQDASLVSKDAIIISPHKMIGGVNTPGILVVKKSLVSQLNAPSRSGGGTVFYVSSKHHRFLLNRTERYEGGTPNIIGIFRAGLTFLFKHQVETKYQQILDENPGAAVPKSIAEHEYETYNSVVSTLRKTAPNLFVLGTYDRDITSINGGPKNLPVFSFLIKCGKRFLHANYVCALLNDVFGIQSRGGCMCAGPYSQILLGLAEKNADGLELPNKVNEGFEHYLMRFQDKAELFKPGYTRLSLPFKGLSSVEQDYVLDALAWVAKNGWVMMPQYLCNPKTGVWFHRNQNDMFGQRRRLCHFQLDDRPVAVFRDSAMENLGVAFAQALENADELLAAARDNAGETAVDLSDDSILCNDDGMELLRWYVYPSECAQWVAKGVEIVPFTYTDMLLGGVRPLGFFDQSKELNKASPRTTDEKGMIPRRDTATWGKPVDPIRAPSGSTAKMGKSYSIRKMIKHASVISISKTA